ncbi:MAG TPA: glycosyltransferase [Chitinophagales bacterium]|nr:glycosyltransferase [Chitinophagales bacterium]HRK29171.1 glycosyltransferase [Chitinophagales bacterium]
MPLTVLVAPLNWGLGHATRCIPIIELLLQKGVNVLLAGDGSSLALLQSEFPQLTTLQLPPYHITYPTAGGSMALTMAAQIPKILLQIRAEHLALQKIARQYPINAVIADNRYGCYLPNKPAVFITHQIFIQAPDLPFAEPVLHQLNQLFIKRFRQCWIPDLPHPHHNLSGKLSHKLPLPAPMYRFTGFLSRMKPYLPHNYNPPHLLPRYKAAIILSGPEPQRTLLEQLVIEQAQQNPHLSPLALVRGITQTNQISQTDNLHIFDHLTTPHLNALLLRSNMVIARSGYSTIMDLAATGVKAALIPTPGQTEQEYLARRFFQKGIFYASAQNNFSLQNAIKETPNYTGLALQPNNLLLQTIEEFILQL